MPCFLNLCFDLIPIQSGGILIWFYWALCHLFNALNGDSQKLGIIVGNNTQVSGLEKTDFMKTLLFRARETYKESD